MRSLAAALMIRQLDHCAVQYLHRVLGLLRDVRIVGVLWRPELLLLTVGEEHRLVALHREQQLGPLGAKRTSHLRVQVNHLWSEQHLRLLLLQHILW